MGLLDSDEGEKSVQSRVNSRDCIGLLERSTNLRLVSVSRVIEHGYLNICRSAYLLAQQSIPARNNLHMIDQVRSCMVTLVHVRICCGLELGALLLQKRHGCISG
jgi:hypothetical protein